MADETFSEPFSDLPVELPVTDVFDLHSVPAKDIEGVVEEYLAEAHRLGYRALRIIHGRGIGVQTRNGSRDSGADILRRELRRCACREAGGWGSTVVALR